MMKFTDSHCHLDFDEFAQQLPQLLAQCQLLGITKIVVPAVGPQNWQKVLDLASQQDLSSAPGCRLYPCLGIHPWFLSHLTQRHLDALSCLVDSCLVGSCPVGSCPVGSCPVDKGHTQLVAIGETGIDCVIAKQQDNLAQQQTFFAFQLQLAKQHKLPIIVHHRQSHHYIVPMLKQAGLDHGGIIHAFSGSYQQAKAYVDLGFSLGIGGTISYARAVKTTKAVARLPLSSLVLETDAPSMPLSGAQGQANSPLQLVNVFQHLVALRPEPALDIANQLEANIARLFALETRG